MTSDTDNNNSEDDVSPEAHNKLLDAVSKMYKKKRVDAPTRKEPALEISEFHLTQPELRKKPTKVKIYDLVKILKKKSKHDNLTNKLIQSQKQTRTLSKPLEKPQAERINRAIGYKNVKDQLNRWDPIVYQQRVAEHVTFPLHQPEITEPKSTNFLTTFSKPTELELKMAEILKQSDEIEAKHRAEKEEVNEEEEFPLTLAEIVERRQLMAKVRAQQSYREAKAARQSKIKSKKFHRIQKRERIKTEIKEFEELQKKDPEAALKKLEQLEKTRAEERASLRHKSTGQWAKNLTVRAKYDKEARIALAEQLNKSKQLTQKLQTNKDTSEEEEEENSETDELVAIESSDPNNPWVEKSEVKEFYSGYKKYWEDKNKAIDLNNSNKIPILKEVQNHNLQNVNKNNQDLGNSSSINNLHVNSILKDNILQKEENGKDNNFNKNSLGKLTKDLKATSNNEKQIGKQNFKKGKSITVNDNIHKQSNINIRKKASEESGETQMITGKSGTWIITTVNEQTESKNSKTDSQFKNPLKSTNKRKREKISKKNIKDLINDLNNLDKKVKEINHRKIKNGKKTISLPSDSKNEMEETDSDSGPSLEMKKSKMTADIDEELDEVAGSSKQPTKAVDSLKKLVSLDLVTEKSKQVEPTDDIDPTKFLTVTPKYLNSQVPDLMTSGEQLDDDEEAQEEERHLTITEAFADDDIVDEFRKAKEEETKKGAVENIDLSLPGWGSWGGPNISARVTRRKKRRFLIKMPKAIPRKDDRKGNVIINEDMDLSLKEHRVSELPFPFTSVKEFEASIRAPIGTNWVPQTAHRKLTLPPVLTKMGAIIEPMNESQLIKTQN